MCIVMGICVSALACVPFVIKHILLQNFVSTPIQALQAFWIQWVQVKGMYVTAEVYFVYVVNYCEANRLKFGAPGWIM